jgi:hypothetical protein
MSYRFIRENSQIIAAIATSGYATIFLIYKLKRGDFLRDSIYDFKNKNDIYEDLTIKENEKCQKVDFTFFFFFINLAFTTLTIDICKM